MPKNIALQSPKKENTMAEENHWRKHDHIPEEARAHLQRARSEMLKSFEGLLPPAFVKHRRAARKEMLLAAKEMINFALDRLDNKETE
jgi:hypothetical protein